MRLFVAHCEKAFLIWGVSSPEPIGVTVHVEPSRTTSAMVRHPSRRQMASMDVLRSFIFSWTCFSSGEW